MSHLSDRMQSIIEAMDIPVHEAVEIEHKDFTYHGFVRDVITMISTTSAKDGDLVNVVLTKELYNLFRATSPLLGLVALMSGKRKVATALMIMDLTMRRGTFVTATQTYNVQFFLNRKPVILRLKQIAAFAERQLKEAMKDA